MEQLVQWYKNQGIPEAFVKSCIVNMPKDELKGVSYATPTHKEVAKPKQRTEPLKEKDFDPKSEMLAIELLATLCDYDQVTILEALSIVNLEIVDTFGK